MERERAESRYGKDPRVQWPATGHRRGVKNVIGPEHISPEIVQAAGLLNWDGKIYSDERLEIGTDPLSAARGWLVALTSEASSRVLTGPAGFPTRDAAIDAVLGHPQD